MITKHVPNAITSLNLASGCVSIVFAFNGSFKTAALFILLAAVFDFLDGFAARLLKSYSTIGKELDSLADMVSFGVAPGMILYQFMLELSDNTGGYAFWAWFAFLIPVFSALRLAKFNLDKRQTLSFLGLPTPANAMFWSFGVAFTYDKLFDFYIDPWVIVPFICLFVWMLVSEIPMFSLKIKHFGWSQNKQAYTFLISSAFLVIFFGLAGVSACILLYILVSFFSSSYVRRKRKA